jgi:mannan endo-1,4-beta-mannosidase
MFQTKFARTFLSCATLAVLAACGGGGGSSSSTDTSTPTTVQKPDGTMRVEAGAVLSASSKSFVMRGINLQYGDDPSSRLAMIDEIADTGANTIRLELRSSTTADQLRSALDEIVARGLVAVVMYWESDVTCQSDTKGFEVAMTRWTDTWKAVLGDAKYKANLVLNIANEWGDANAKDAYLNTYRDAIARLRAAGYQFPLMIDAASCGQQYSVFANGGATALAQADPYRNVIFSTHAYWSYQTSAAIDAAIAAVQGQGQAFVWGEFGQAAFQASTGNATDHRYLIKHAEDIGIGYLAWSWYGNGGDAQVLDMRQAGVTPLLTAYGEEVVNGGSSFKGIRATSVLIGN